jgi:major membrane immunogen (membrane-anchored lipoprotein)
MLEPVGAKIMKKILALLLWGFIPGAFFIFSFFSCSRYDSVLEDGYYTAEAREFDEHGWKEFITICVSGGKIITVEYNAKNPGGLIKSWDMNYMRVMNDRDGTYPNEYTRLYGAQLLELQGIEGIDGISGATNSYNSFIQLAEAALNQSKAGDTHVVFVQTLGPVSGHE